MLVYTIFSYNLEIKDILILLAVGLLSGMSKTGVHGASMLSVPLLALVFGGQNSSGVMLPILLIADAIGVWYYHRHASVKHLKIIIPWAISGIVLGTVIGKLIDDHIFRLIMATTILGSIVIMFWLNSERHKDEVPNNPFFAGTMGILGGFTSMVGNLAGSVMAVYLLAVRLPKNIYIGTTSWFFLIINWAKVPFHVLSWHTINLNTALLSLLTSPAIILGAVIGIAIIKKISEEKFRIFIISMTVLASFFMLL